MKDILNYVLEHRLIETIVVLFPIIPSVISIFVILLERRKKEKEPAKKLITGYEIGLIILGFSLFHANTCIIGMVTGVYICGFILANCKRIHEKKAFGGFGFPSMFFFNMASFSGESILVGVIAAAYTVVGGIYLYGLLDIDGKEGKETDYLEKHEKRCFLLSGIFFITCKIVFLLFTDTL